MEYTRLSRTGAPEICRVSRETDEMSMELSLAARAPFAIGTDTDMTGTLTDGVTSGQISAALCRVSLGTTASSWLSE